MTVEADELAIHQLAAAYADACNRMSAVDMASVYAPDGELIALQFSERPIKGREKLLKVFNNLIADRDFIYFMIFSGIVNIAGDTATARWWVAELRQVRGDDKIILILASYQDKAIRGPEGWRFAQRMVKPMFQHEIQGKDLHLPAPPFLPLSILPELS